MHFLETHTLGGAGGVPNIKIVKNLSIEVHSSQKSIYSIPTHLKPTITPKQWSQKMQFQPPEVICGFSDAKLKALKESPQKNCFLAPYFKKA